MGQFSDDGQWWWDGSEWIATSNVVIPDLAASQTERARQLVGRQRQVRQADTVGSWPIFSGGMDLVVGLPFLFIERRTFRECRVFALELLQAATAYLLGPDEPMVAGEISLSSQPLLSVSTEAHGVGVVVTAVHVLVLRMDPVNGQPRSIGLAALARDVVVEAPMPFFSKPIIVVRNARQRWWIQGEVGIIKRDPVVAAWRAAAGVKT